MSRYHNPLLNVSIEVDSDPESVMEERDANYANLEKKYVELKQEYAGYKEESEKAISRHEARIKQLRDDLIDHIFSRGIAFAGEKEMLERKINELEEVVKGLKGQALQSENDKLKVEKAELQSKLQRQDQERERETDRKEKIQNAGEYVALLSAYERLGNQLVNDRTEKVQLQIELQRYQGLERQVEADRKEKVQREGEHAALLSAYERLGNQLVDATNRLNSQSAKEPNYFNAVQELQIKNCELVKENQELKLKLGNVFHSSMEVERWKIQASDLHMKLLAAQHREAIERAQGQSHQQEAMKLKAQNHQLGTALLACQGKNKRLVGTAYSHEEKIKQLEQEKNQIIERCSEVFGHFKAQNLSHIEEATKFKAFRREQDELVSQALLHLSTALENIVEGTIQGFRNRFGDRVRFTRMMFTLLCKKLEVKSKKGAGSLITTIDDERLVQDIREITEAIREDAVMPLQRLVLDLEQEGEQARRKVKWFKEEAYRIFGGKCSDDNGAEEGAQPELTMEDWEQTSPQVDEPETFTPDADSDSTREAWELVNIYDSETDEDTELSPIPRAFTNRNDKKAHVETDDSESIPTRALLPLGVPVGGRHWYWLLCRHC